MKTLSKLFAFVGCVGLVTLAGCTTFNHSKPGFAVSVPVSAKAKATVKLGGEVEGKAEVTRILGFIVLPQYNMYADGVSYGAGGAAPSGGLLSSLLGSGPSDADQAKSLAAYQALKDEYDVILGARYMVQTDDMYIIKTTIATVKGWGGKVESVAITQ